MNEFDSPQLLIAQARNDITQLESALQIFLESCHGVPIIVDDPKSTEKIIKYRIDQTIPGQLRTLASNALNNLRHALDQCVNSAGTELGARERDCYFPFARSSVDLEIVINKRCKRIVDLAPELVPVLKSFQPYPGGDDLLYALSRIVGPNKHQIVLRMDVCLPDPMQTKDLFSLFNKAIGPITLMRRWDSKKQELQIARVGTGGGINCRAQAKLPIFISIADSKLSATEPATAFVNVLADKVEGIITAIKVATRAVLDARVGRRSEAKTI